jgi:hypothetical protein
MLTLNIQPLKEVPVKDKVPHVDILPSGKINFEWNVLEDAIPFSSVGGFSVALNNDVEAKDPSIYLIPGIDGDVHVNHVVGKGFDKKLYILIKPFLIRNNLAFPATVAFKIIKYKGKPIIKLFTQKATQPVTVSKQLTAKKTQVVGNKNSKKAIKTPEKGNKVAKTEKKTAISKSSDKHKSIAAPKKAAAKKEKVVLKPRGPYKKRIPAMVKAIDSNIKTAVAVKQAATSAANDDKIR